MNTATDGPRALRVGTRGSALAVAQTGLVADALAAASGLPVEIVRVTTHGDVSRASLSSLGGTGVFAAALRERLLDGAVDVAVHSFKDLPTEPVAGLVIGAVPQRADARDVLVTRDGTALADLPVGARVGTGSPRRAAQLHARRPDLEVVDIRGNVDTRLGRLHADGDERLDGVVLAAAGLVRLQRSDVAAVPFAQDSWPTAPGQGALAVEVRAGDVAAGPLADALRAIDHSPSHVAADAERAVLAGLSAGCSAPVGTTARVAASAVEVSAAVYALDGSRQVSASATAAARDTSPDALEAAGRAAAAEVVSSLMAQGAADIAPIGGSL